MKSFIVIFFLTAFFIGFMFSPNKVYAGSIFEETFDVDDSKWIVESGTWQIKNGKYGAFVSNPSQGAKSTAILDISTPNYTIDLDMFPVQGTDRNIRFRFGGSPGEYDLHFTNDGIATNFGVDSHSVILVNHPLSDNHSYHVKILLEGQHFQVFIDGNLIFDIFDSSYFYSGPEKFYLVVSTGSSPTEVYFDNISVKTNDDSLSVPLLKQTNPLWINDLYDSALLWSSGGKGMGNFGCAVTSAAMVFKYYGVNKMPDNTDLTPGALNNWLKSSLDGYVRNGMLNWLALGRIVRLAKFYNSYSFDALEYSKINQQDDDALKEFIKNKIPGILETPGHFVVAKGTDSNNSTFLINDPYFDRVTLADTYNKSYLTLGTYTPANSDLSYIMMVVNPTVDISITDEQGNLKGSSFMQNPIIAQIDGAANSKGPLKIFYFKKPQAGKYILKLKSNNAVNYQLDRYFYDVNGNYNGGSTTGNLNSGVVHSFTINFDKVSSSKSNFMKITFDYIREEIVAFYNSKKIKNVAVYHALLQELNAAKNSKSKIIVKTLLDTMIFTIKSDKKIDSKTAVTLITDIQLLKSSL